MNIVCIIQARTTSTRLPNKVLLPLPYGSNTTVLEQVINRVRKSKLVNNIVVATTINKTDDKIEQLCDEMGIIISRGSEDNVLERYYNAAKDNNAGVVIRITSDCPFVDWEIIDKVISKHMEEKNDYTSNVLELTYPDGIDVEVFNFNVLEEAYLNATEIIEKEHVTPYIYKTKKDKFKISCLQYKENYSHIRITLDTEQDYNLILTIQDYFKDKEFLLEDILKLLNEKKWLLNINKDIEAKKVCVDLKEELIELQRLAKKQDLNRSVEFLKEKINSL